MFNFVYFLNDILGWNTAQKSQDDLKIENTGHTSDSAGNRSGVLVILSYRFVSFLQ